MQMQMEKELQLETETGTETEEKRVAAGCRARLTFAVIKQCINCGCMRCLAPCLAWPGLLPASPDSPLAPANLLFLLTHRNLAYLWP